ncbi:MAG: ABC transporter permease [Eubacteriales bacterium]|nr:ABC transporter permease [Eubacteriales bacterium]MDD3350119.1 ABC transporter permease [Eubacteriales bacterium]
MFSTGLLETLYMTLVSTLLAYAIGLPLGLALVVTSESLSKTAHITNSILGIIVNLLRSVPFLILLIAVTPFTRIVVGTTIGSTATIVPLVIASAPFIARLVESSVKEVDRGVIEAAQCMGASTMQIIRKVMLPEAKPSLVIGAAIAVTTILSYSAMAGIVGGGGLGTIAINYGLYRYKYDIMLVTIAILVIVVQIFQEVGMKLAKIGDRRINQ